MTEPQDKTDNSWSWVFLAIIAFVIIYPIYTKIKNNNSKLGAGVSPSVDQSQQPVDSSTATEKIAIISVKGIINNRMVAASTDKLKIAAADPNIKAILLQIE